MTQEVLKLSQEALAGLKDVEKQVRELVAENKALKETLAQTQEPFAYVNVEKRRLEFASPYVKWDTPTTIKLDKIPLYTTPPQRTERPADCERCNRLEEHAYDLVGKLRVANIKLSMQPQRTWVDLTEAERIDIIDEEITAQGIEHFALAQAIEAKLKEKNT